MSEQAGAAPSERVYDVVVIGGVQSAWLSAQRTRADGLSVVIVEKELLGGECDYWACVPSKALLRPVVAIPVVAIADARRVEGARKAVEGPLDAPVFCDPEATAVGLSAKQAERAGHRVRAVDVEFGRVKGASPYADGYRGRARMVVDLDHGYLLGVTFVGLGVAELLHSATVAVAGQVPIDRLWHAVPCFPTISEVWLRLLEAHRG